MREKRKSNFRGKVADDVERQKKAAAGFGYLALPTGVKTFSPDPEGRVKMDILPYEVTDEHHPDRNEKKDIAMPGTLWYKRPFKVHRNIGADNDQVVCLTSVGKKCPICETRAEMIKKGADKEDTDALKPSLRNLYCIIPLDSKKYDPVPHIMDISQAMFQKKLNSELDEDLDNQIFPDIEEGLTLKVRFEARTFGKGKPFPEAGRIDFVEREETYTEKILEEVPNLDKVLVILSYDELNKKFLEVDDDDLDEREDKKKRKDPEEEEEPRSRRRKSDDDLEEERSSRKRKPVDEEDEPPTRRRREPEPEEEEKPLRRKRNEEPEPDPDDEPKSRTARSGTASGGKGVNEDECPHGHRFGVDTDRKKECDTCDVWDACDAEKTKRKKL